MLSTNIPTKIPIPFANSAGSSYKNTIPQASQIGITNGKASLTDGFPPLTFQPISSGGVPPFGADFNGILNEITAITQWQQAGGFFAYDSSFSSTISGYPKGSILQSANLAGLWVSTAENNTTNPDTGGAGWTSLAFEGSQAISITTADVTLTQLQSAYPVLIVSGAITAARNLIFPAVVGEWIVQNNTTGAFNLTAKTASGTGVTLTQGQSTYIYGDGTNIVFADSAKVASFNGRVGTVTLTATDVTNALGYVPPTPTGGGASGTWGISISGNAATTSQTNFTNLTIATSQVLYAGNYNSYSPTLTGAGASGTWGINVTGSAASATNATNSVNATTSTTQAVNTNTTAIATTAFVHDSLLGSANQSWQDVTASRALGTTYTNTTGRPITVTILCTGSYIAPILYVNGVFAASGRDNTAAAQAGCTTVVEVGATYMGTGGTLSTWTELR